MLTKHITKKFVRLHNHCLLFTMLERVKPYIVRLIFDNQFEFKLFSSFIQSENEFSPSGSKSNYRVVIAQQ